MGDDIDARVQGAERSFRRVCLFLAHCVCCMNDLTLQISQIHLVIVDDAQRADPRRGQVHQNGRAETARTDHKHARR